MKKILIPLAAVMAIAAGPLAASDDWAMVQKDSSHTGFSEQGPRAPLKKAWFARSDDPKSSFTTWPVVFDGVVYAKSGPGVMAVDARIGKKIWYTKPEGGQHNTAPAVDENAVYVPAPPNFMLALDRKTGAELWRFTADREIDVSPTLHEGKLYVGSLRNQVFHCLNAQDGSLVWKINTEFRPDAVPVVSQGLVVFSTEHVGSTQVMVLALDAGTGMEVWRAQQKESNSSPAILDDKVIIGGGDFFAYALDLKTGREIWKSPVEDKFSVRNSPAIAFGDVFLVDRVGNFYRLDGKTGERKWFLSNKNIEGVFNQSFPVVAGNTIFIGGSSGRVYAVDARNGKLLWSDDPGGWAYTGAADSERFYFGVRNSNEGLYAYEHDPTRNLAKPKNPSASKSVLRALLIALVILGAVLLIIRRMRKSPPKSM